ncbi:helix-turn-helix domain-containing protein [Rhodobacteraceae bacterium PD-2]|uniref:Excisionase family DNA-binding protein n=1 Tax=Ponticoccus alexandrii TaxID=1943633 RepID=A0ABX7F920_9RHOB|nr:excisionase family DNA-binding protein [Ponticoccus alexandrii]
MTAPRPLTPDKLAERWECSPETVRQLCRSNALRSFRLGRLYRIPMDAVEEYECQTSASDDFAAGSASTGASQMESGPAMVLRHAPERTQKPRQ